MYLVTFFVDLHKVLLAKLSKPEVWKVSLSLSHARCYLWSHNCHARDHFRSRIYVSSDCRSVSLINSVSTWTGNRTINVQNK